MCAAIIYNTQPDRKKGGGGMDISWITTIQPLSSLSQNIIFPTLLFSQHTTIFTWRGEQTLMGGNIYNGYMALIDIIIQ